MSGLRIAVVGASGRMGRAVVRLAPAHGLAITRAVASSKADVGRDAGEVAGCERTGVTVEPDVASLVSGGFDVVVDFSAPDATAALAEMAGTTRAAIVSGTTGLGNDEKAALERASAHVAVFWEPNMSFGVQVLADLVRRAAAQLGQAFDVEVTETHHRKKVDAPSGTALRLVEAVREGQGLSPPMVYGRYGRPGPRASEEVAVHAIRGGDVIGDHTVHFLGNGERIELTHRATDRDLFAHGALRAAAFVAGKPAGRYTMRDLLR
jgi:4-hydroxy-tetrahydrodipicolinate reductase